MAKKQGSGATSSAIVEPNFGLYLGQPSITIPARGMEDCLNVRIKRGKVSSFLMGWEKFYQHQLVGPVTLLDEFFFSDGTVKLIAGTLLDFYEWTGTEFLFLTPIYNTGTISSTGSSVLIVGIGTAWLTNAKMNDYIYIDTFGNTDQRHLIPATGDWYRVVEVVDDTHINVDRIPPVVTNVPYTLRQTFRGATLMDYWRTAIFPNADAASQGGGTKDRWYATNNLDYPIVWDGLTAHVERLSGLAFRCLDLHHYKNTLVYINITDDSDGPFPRSIRTSDVGKPETMSGGLSGEFIVAPDTAQLITAEHMGDDLAVFTENEVVMMSFVGAPNIYAFRTAVNGTGIIGGQLLAQFGNTLQFMARDALYSFNGVTADPVDNHVWNSNLRSQDQNRVRAGYAIFDEENGDLLWVFPKTSDGTDAAKYAYVAHYVEDIPTGTPTPYTRRDFPFSAAGFYTETAPQKRWSDLTDMWGAYNFSWGDRILSAAFPLMLAGDTNGFIYKVNTIDTQDGAGYPSYATFPRRFIGDYKHRNLLSRVYIMARELPTASYPLTVTATLYDHEGQQTGNHQIQSFGLDFITNNFVSPYRVGRLAQVQFGTLGDSMGQPWEVQGYDFEIKGGGQR